MAHPDAELVRNAYEALNRHDIDSFLSAFAQDAVMHGADGEVTGRDAIRSIVQELIALSEESLQIEVHDVLANDEHTVVLQTTTAQLGDRRLSDRVVYVFHVESGLIKDAFFVGDPSVQTEFYGLA